MRPLIVLLVTGLFMQATTVTAQNATFANPRIIVLENAGDGGYRTTEDPQLADVRQRMIKRGPLQQYVQFMSPVRIGKRLGILATGCNGAVNMWYSSSTNSITVCYEFMRWVEAQADLVGMSEKSDGADPIKLTRNSFIAGVFAGVLLHETGHAIFDLAEVPVFGREEDAADQFAAFIAVQFHRQIAETVVAATATLLRATGDKPTTAMDAKDPRYPKLPANSGTPDFERTIQIRCTLDPMCAWSDEHGSGTQRFFNMTCLVYGSAPQLYSSWKSAGWVAPGRDCEGEYKRAARAFAATIYPFIDPVRMREVQKVRWFLQTEVKD